MLYFAYGSNMLPARLQDHRRAPSAAPLGIGALSGHRLVFTKRGRDGSGKCTVVRADRATAPVWGVLYRLALSDLAALDREEGIARGGYVRRSLTIGVTAARTVTAAAYVADAAGIDDALRPFDWYAALVTAGARHHSLPAAYIARLAAHPTVADPDPRRRRAAEAVLRHPVPPPSPLSF